MGFSRMAAVAAAVAVVTLAGCNSSRIGALDTRGSSQPDPLPAAPSGTVSQSQLPPPASPTPPPPSQFPDAPQSPTDALNPDQMSPDIAAAAGETQVAAATPPAGGADVTPGAVAGVWNASVSGQSCRIATPQTSFGPGYRAAPLGCPAPISNLKAWAAKGKQLVLYDEGGNQIATLYSSASGKFDGSTSSGTPISLTR